MRKIFGLVLLIISVNVFGQNPPGYQSRVVRERIQGSFMVDSGLHVPRYCGVPSGVRGGVSVQDGAIAMDTCNNRFYIYSGGAWLGLASFSETATRFGKSGEDVRFGEDRTPSGIGTYGLKIDSLADFWVGFKTSSGKTVTFFDYETSKTRFLLDVTKSALYSPSQATNLRIYEDTAFIALQSTSSKLLVTNLASGVGTKSLRYNPSDGRITYADTTAGGGGWGLSGNSGITPVTNFIGTTDSKSLYFKTNGAYRGKIDSNGTWLINRSAAFTSGGDAVVIQALDASTFHYALMVANSGGSGLFSVDNAANINFYGFTTTTWGSSSIIDMSAATVSATNINFAGYAQHAEISTPSTPSSGFGRYYEKSDNLPYFINDAGTELRLSPQSLNKGVFIASPTSADTIDVWQTPVAITITSLKTILRGSSSPSVTFNIGFGTNIQSPTAVFTADITCTSITTGCSNSSGFNDATIPAGSFIWIYTNAKSGTVNSIAFTINYTED